MRFNACGRFEPTGTGKIILWGFRRGEFGAQEIGRYTLIQTALMLMRPHNQIAARGGDRRLGFYKKEYQQALMAMRIERSWIS